MNKLAICMIIKNEEHIIERCLDSIKNYISYWIICDTGSNDNSINIIKKKLINIPGQLFQDNWIDFGYNRNLALKRSKEICKLQKINWLLLADADYEFIINDLFFLNNLEISTPAYLLEWTDDYVTGNKLINVNYDWYYIGKTHEFIICHNVDDKTLPILKNIKIKEHYDGFYRKIKSENDLKLLNEQYSIDKNPRWIFFIANTYFIIQKYKEAHNAYLLYLKQKSINIEEIYMAYIRSEIVNRFSKKDYSLEDVIICLQNMEKAATIFPLRPEAYYISLCGLFELKRFDLASQIVINTKIDQIDWHQITPDKFNITIQIDPVMWNTLPKMINYLKNYK